MSSHALRRSQERSVSDVAIAAALAFGVPIPQPLGRTAYHLGAEEAAEALRAGYDDRRLEGVIVVVGPDGGLVTVIRSGDRRRLHRHGRTSRRSRRPTGRW